MTTVEQSESDVDEVAVQRAVEGDINVRLTVTELREALARLEDEGLPDETISTTLGVTRRSIVRWRASGGPTEGRLGDPQASARWSPQSRAAATSRGSAPAPPSVSSLDALLQTAHRLASDAPAVKKALDRALTAIDNLKTAIDDTAVKASARAEVARLEAALTEAKARLRGSPASPSPSTEGERARSQTIVSDWNQPKQRAGSAVPYAEVNRWLRSQGIPTGRGRPPRDLVDRYLAAHGT